MLQFDHVVNLARRRRGVANTTTTHFRPVSMLMDWGLVGAPFFTVAVQDGGGGGDDDEDDLARKSSAPCPPLAPTTTKTVVSSVRTCDVRVRPSPVNWIIGRYLC